MAITTALELWSQEGTVGEGTMHETDFPLNHNGHKASLLRVAVPQ